MMMNDPGNYELEMLDLFELTPDLVCIAGKDGYFKKVNPAVLQKLGYTEEELFSRPISFNIHEEDREQTLNTRNEMLEGKALVNFQNRYIKKDGSIVWLQWTSIFLPGKDIVFAIAKDITESKQKEKEIEERFQAYKVMATHFKNRAEENRKYLAHELYEEIAQLSAVVKMNLAWMNQHLVDIADTVKQKMQEALQVSDMLIKSVRRVSFAMSPQMLEDLGFNATLEWECKEFAVLNGIPCTFKSSCSETSIPVPIRIDLFRISQEAFHNIMEHAEATAVHLSLKEEGDYVSLVITDNGIGFDVNKHIQSAGLQHIKQLAASIHAEVSIESKPGEGTTVAVRVKKLF